MTNREAESGIMVYPKAEWRKLMFKAPLVLWRMGWGPLLGQRLVVLTTTGRKSGLPRHTMTEYGMVDNRVVIASGWGERAQWVKNLEADPLLTAQTAQGVQHCRARRIDDEATLRKVYHAMRSSPAFDATMKVWDIQPSTLENMLANKDKTYFYILEPTAQPTPPPLDVDLPWVNWALLGAAFVGWLLGRSRRA